MAGEITREELNAFTEANKQNALVMNDVLALIEEEEGKIDKLTIKIDDNKKEIIDTIVGITPEGTKTTLSAVKKDTGSMCNDARMTKYFIGAISLVVIISTVITTIIIRGSWNRENKVVQEIQRGN